MELSIIIPTRDRAAIFHQTLQAAIAATRHLDCEIIVVNDAPNQYPEVPPVANVALLNNPGRGVAAARNFGFAHARGSVVLFLDNDILISKRSVDHMLRLHSLYPGACFNLDWEYTPETVAKLSGHPFSRFLETSRMTSFKGWYNDAGWQENALFRSKSVSSFHLSILRESFARSGGYNEGFPHAGFEDYDFPRKLKQAGIEFFIDTREKVYHNELDRLDLDNWLASQERRAITRKKAVALGYPELALEYPFLKKIVLDFIYRYESWFRDVLRILPNRTFFDPFYFRLVSALQASRIYKGYMLS